MSIGFYNFQKLHNPKFQDKILKRFEEIVKSNGFVEGNYNSSFEQRFAKMQGANHCLLVANGTDAIEIALQAYGVGYGDKVGIPSISFYATAEAVYNVGATPVFIDIDSSTGLLDPDSLENILRNTELKAIIPVHIYGLPAPIEKLEVICSKNNIKIIEDGAQSQGGFYENGNPIGSSNNLTTYSFYPTKNLGAFGDAGAILTNNDDLALKIASIRNHGRSPDGHALIGRNSRCDHLQAAVLDLKLDTIEEENKNRKNIAKKYLMEFEGVDAQVPEKKYLEFSSWHLFPIQVKSRELKYGLKEHLASKGIGSALFYEKAMAEEKPLQHVPGEKQKGIDFASLTLCLPMNPFLSHEDIIEVVKEVKYFLNQ
jgi:dTDP-4-amino-4,6-dideoxygalactose transaminase